MATNSKKLAGKAGKKVTYVGPARTPAPAPRTAPKAAAPAAPTAPVAPPQIMPFLTAEDLLGQIGFDFTNAQSLADIDKTLADLSANVGMQRKQTDKQATQNKSEATDSSIARGLFRSSVKDAQIYDIEANRALQQQFFTDQLNNASLDADRRKRAIFDAQQAQQQAMALKAVQNAQAASAQQSVAPAAASGGGATANAAAAIQALQAKQLAAQKQQAAQVKAAASVKPKGKYGMTGPTNVKYVR